jgi:glutathione S-transferase
MLELKGIDYELVHVLPGNQRIHLRMAGFRHGTVPALKIDGRRVQGTIAIARELERIQPDPPLFPADPELRTRVEAAERWGDAELQNVPRRILRWAMTQDPGLRKWLGEADGALPAPAVAARVTGPVSRYYARVVHADKEHVRRDIAGLPSTLDRVDELIEQKVVDADKPNAATFQVLCSIRSLLGFEDFEEQVGQRRSGALARRLYPDFPEQKVPPFVQRLGVG